MWARLLPLGVLFAPCVNGQATVQVPAAQQTATATQTATQAEKLLLDKNKFVTIGPSVAPDVTVGQCPSECSALYDVTMGWKDGCQGLDKIESATLAECQAGCCSDWSCEVWQWGDEGCFRGKYAKCGLEPSGTVTAGQMIQHGAVKVLDPEKTRTKCENLNIHHFAKGTVVEKQSKCRKLCYSDSTCILWQAGSGGVCHYGPKMRLDGTRFDVDCDATKPGADIFVTGELIEHYCAGAPAATAPPAEAEGTGMGAGTMAAIIGGILATAIIVGIIVHSMAGKAKPKKTRALKIPDEPKSEEVPLNYTYVSTPAPMQYIQMAPPMTVQSQPLMTSQPMYSMPNSPGLVLR